MRVIRSSFWFVIGVTVSVILLAVSMACADQCVTTFIVIDGVTKMCITCDGVNTFCS